MPLHGRCRVPDVPREESVRKEALDKVKPYVDGVFDSLNRTRVVLITISILASWLISTQVSYLLQWEPIRRPISYNLVKLWRASSQLTADSVLAVTVPRSALMSADLVRW